MTWITLKTTGTRWEADLMHEILSAHHIPSRVLNQGIAPHFGCSAPAVLQVRAQDQWTALLLLSPVEDDGNDSDSWEPLERS